MPLKVKISRADKSGKQFTELVLGFDNASRQVALMIFQPMPSGTATLNLGFEYHPEQLLMPIHLDAKQY
ncbi:hypothetical protein FB639_003518, partial [Coemansia asiatica]